MKKSLIIAAAAIFALAAGGGAIAALASTHSTTSEALRAKTYSSVEDLVRDSPEIVVVTVGQNQTDIPIDVKSQPPLTVSEVTVSKVLPNLTVTEKSAVAVGDNLRVFQVGGDQDDQSPILEKGATYLLFLTPTEMGDALAQDYFPVGIWAGIYRSTPGGQFRQVTSSGDKLPSTLDTSTLSDLIASLQAPSQKAN